MKLNAPEWLLLVPLLMFLIWYLRAIQWRRPLRLLCLALLVFALCDPQLSRFSPGLDVWVLVDQSSSAADAMAAHEAEIEDLLTRSKGASDNIHFLDFAETAEERETESDRVYEGDRDSTRMANAIEVALSRLKPDRAARLLVVTDGYSTEPLSGLEYRLHQQEVPLDYRLLESPDLQDYQVDFLHTAQRVRPGEPFLIELQVSGNPDASVPYEMFRDKQSIGRGTVEVRQGVGSLRFTDQVFSPGAHHYRVVITPEHDAIAGNNTGQSWLEVVSGPRVVLVTNYPDDPLIAALRQEQIEVEVETNPKLLNPGLLSGARAVILNNVPANQIPPDFLSAINFFVRQQGGGLLMVGGKYSFGSGGYFKSSIDDLLPVSMELRTDHRKLAVAMAIVMDRSGSMSLAVSNGLTKMDMADDGAARAVELLGPQDAVSVIAVDTEPHVIVPLTVVGQDAGEMAGPIKHIASMGGGIYIDVALQAGWDQLKESTAGQRHFILFADANDSEEPGDYKGLVNEMVEAGVTVSTIGMGTESDKDAGLLEDIAKRGNGRAYFDANAEELPSIFAQETVAIARSMFLKDPVAVQPSSGWAEIAAQPIPWLPSVDGYNLSYLKPEATAALFAKDEYQAPLVAFWQRGVGRAAAISFPLGGDFSQRVRAWSEFGNFDRTVVRWLLGSALPPGLGLRTRLEGTELDVSLLYDESWEERISQSPPRLQIAIQNENGSPAVSNPTWQRIAPGRYDAGVHLPGTQYLRGAVQVGSFVLPFGPVVAGSNPEWTRDRHRLEELKGLSQATGGEQRLDLPSIWKAPRSTGTTPLRNPVLIALLIVMLAEFLQTRSGLTLARKRRL
jgi:Mg-chelatase subunit ChlD